MHLIETVKKDLDAHGRTLKEKAMLGAPFGPGFPEELAVQADYMEVWGSGFKDPGPDFCEFRLFKGDPKAATERIATRRLNGY